MNKINDDDPDLNIIEMTQILIDEFSKYCSKKIRKKNKNNHPWINLKIKKMMNNQNVLHKKWVQTPSIENRSNFTSCRNNVIKAIRVSKRRYYDNMITRKKNSSGIFDALKRFCGKKNVNTASFVVKGFNEHFATIGEKLTEKFKQNVYRSNFSVNKNTFVIYDTNRDELLEEIKNLNNKKSTGHDGISSKMVKFSAPVLADHLALFF